MKLETILDIIDDTDSFTSFGSDTYKCLSSLFQVFVESQYGPESACNALSLQGQPLILPYTPMGNLDSTKLFGIDELIIFSFYRKCSSSVQQCIDIGANIGLHSIVLGRLGFTVKAYEPDPMTFRALQQNLRLNNLTDPISAFNAAVSNTTDSQRFTRVCGNTMSSHLSGSKRSPYGELEEFTVSCELASSVFEGADLIKLDAESHEIPILEQAFRCTTQRPEILMEVGSDTSQVQLYNLLKNNDYQIFSQKSGWNELTHYSELPCSHREGTLMCTQGLLKTFLN